MLFQPTVELLPPSDPNNSLFLAADRPDQPGFNEEYAPKQLEPGEWAHVVFAWVSRSAPEIPCNQYSGLKLHVVDMNPGRHVEDQAAIEARNLWIRSCPSVFVSGYRKGRYSPQSKLTAAWLNSWAPALVPESSYPNQPTSAEILVESPALKLHAPVQRTMVGDLLALRLRFQRGVEEGCAFRLLRKRESNGATVISVQQCAAAEASPDKPVPPYFEAGTARLAIDALDLQALNPGPVSYDVIGVVGAPGAARFASAQVKLMARDPAFPAQAVIIDPWPACKASQLRFASPEPAVSGRLETLRAYEATNVSIELCWVAGVPAVRFLDDGGAHEPFVPKPCPNCDNDQFKARPNGRIDLRPGESAHFLAGVTSIDTEEDPWRHCQRSSKLEWTGSAEDAPVLLPMDAGVCAAIDISAWRAGAFDGDAQNVEWAKKHDAGFEEPGATPPDCDKPGLLKMGRPAMMPRAEHLAFGLSLAARSFEKGQPVPLHLWVDNTGDGAAAVWTCMDLDFFKGRGFDLYDAYGHRLLRKREVELQEQFAKDPRTRAVQGAWSCTRNFQIEIPAHTCVNGDNYDFTAQLTQEYDLPPGEYTVHVRDGTAQPAEDLCGEHPEAPFAIRPGKDLTFQVVQP
jgi:hypothetical protein